MSLKLQKEYIHTLDQASFGYLITDAFDLRRTRALLALRQRAPRCSNTGHKTERFRRGGSVATFAAEMQTTEIPFVPFACNSRKVSIGHVAELWDCVCITS